MVTFTNKMAATDFFPPNPENGELWLPSFIIHEISTANAAVLPSHQPAATTSFEICFGSFGAKPITANSGRVGNYNNKHKLAPAPITPTTTMPQHGVVEIKNRTDLTEKYAGTGVFLPRLTDIMAGAAAAGGRSGGDGAKKREETSGGTGVFLNHEVSVTCPKKKKKSGKGEKTSGSNNKMKCCAINKEDIFGKQENSQHPSGICLPNDWIY